MADKVIVQSDGHTIVNCIFFKNNNILLEIYDHKEKKPFFSMNFKSKLELLRFLSNLSNLYFGLMGDDTHGTN